MADIVEPILEATKIVAEKLISEVRFDQTVKATIVNDSNAYRGEYLVSTGNATFTAYCADDKYKKDDAVLVTVPEGDYKNQKVIIGKQVDDTNSVIHKLSPFQSITDVTGNLISKFVYDDNQLKTADAIYANMYANGKQNDPDFNYFSWDYGISDFIASDVYNRSLTLINFPNQNSSAVGGTENSTITSTVDHPGLIWDSGVINQPGYTRLGLQAQFKTWLGDYNIVHGHYGLMLQVQFKIVEELDDNSQSVDYFYKYLDFSNEDFFGDSYNFETFYTQEKVFDLTKFVDYPITRLRLFAYEREDFLTMENIPIEYFGVGGITTAGYNIFIKDPYICLGFDANEYQGDTALICPIENSSVIYTKDISSIQSAKDFIDKYTTVLGELNAAIEEEEDRIPTKNTIAEAIAQLKEFQENEKVAATLDKYERQLANNTKEFSYYEEDAYNLRDQENKKIIELRWVHKDEEKEIIKLMANGEVPPHYFIQWYRYKLGAKSPDQFAGAHWVRFYGTVDNVKGNAELEDTGIEETLDANSNDLNLDSGRAAFEEKRRALQNAYTQAIKDLYKAENTNEAIAAKNVLGSQLAAIDTATNTTRISFYPNPNYAEEKFKVIIVKQDPYSNHLSKVAESNVLTFTNQTDVRSEATIIDENALSIKYSDDEKGVYLIYDRSGHIGKEEQGEVRKLTAVFDEDISNVNDKPDLNNYTSIKWIFPDNNTMIIPMADETTTATTDTVFDTVEVYYTIKKNLNRGAINNTVRLEVVKDGLEYTAQAQMIFGTAGTSGSDYTIYIEWENNQNAIEIDPGSQNQAELNGRVILFDQSGSVLTMPEDAEITVDWYQIFPNNNGGSIIYKDNDLLYPIRSGSSTIAPDSIYVPDISGEPKYYFDLNSKKFKNYTNQINQQLYRRLTYIQYTDNIIDAYKYYKIVNGDYVLITQEEMPIQSNGNGQYILKGTETPINIYIKEPKNQFKFNEINTYNNFSNDYFVKIDDVYIVNPWLDYQETETYYTVSSSTLHTTESQYFDIIKENKNSQTFTIKQKIGMNPLNNNSLNIFRVTISNFGDYNLVALFPLPIKYKTTSYVQNQSQTTFVVDYIEGPTNVRYSTGGEVDFDKNPYQITCREYTGSSFIVKRHGYETDNLSGYWQLIHTDTNDIFAPRLAETRTINDMNKLYSSADPSEHFSNKPYLSPPGVYYQDLPIYGVKFVKAEYDEENGEWDTSNQQTLWIQPILSYQDNYPSTTLNKWNGQDIQTDEDSGTIVANGLAAGKKESDNTFTGVIMGDWSRTDIDGFISKNTGVYGFNHGAMSYALKDDGTAFFGKDGHGRIYFNGNKAQIYSAGWVANKNDKSGMLIDVDDGKIQMKGQRTNVLRETEDITVQAGKIYYYQNGQIIDSYQLSNLQDNKLEHLGVPVYEYVTGSGEIILSQQGNPYFKIKANGNTLIHVSDSQYFLASSNYNGTSAGVKFDLKSGLLEGYSFKIKAIKSSFNRQTYTWNNGDWTYNTITNGLVENSVINIDSNAQTYPLEIGSSFKVDWNGNIRSDGLYTHDLNAWNANISTITATNITASSGSLSDLNVTGSLHVTSGYIYGGNQSFTTSGNVGFKLNNDGKLQASGVEIAGEINAKKGTFANGIKAESFTILNASGTELGTLGYVQSGAIENGQPLNGEGIGITCKTESASKFVITSTNAGMSFNNSWVSCQQGKVTIGGTSDGIYLQGAIWIYDQGTGAYKTLAQYIQDNTSSSPIEIIPSP